MKEVTKEVRHYEIRFSVLIGSPDGGCTFTYLHRWDSSADCTFASAVGIGLSALVRQFESLGLPRHKYTVSYLTSTFGYRANDGLHYL